ncbi:hypothetical protein GOARA_038_00205 [Gordonia araii NBRC 100433]|uniref:Uncharacterized protein n=1 Tax=Gordonia araii NBRC 100433 TaxID=1073574 RepID=G7H0U9_9ACTN|nr:hypothetical protein [Gordonia araii]NNG99188.1 hypothetical protein [Gordonia araii NBRC 100433]GAB09474.1 hypothetical protein GOARA_038_00205 [Gordonia araii NBRC 100433]
MKIPSTCAELSVLLDRVLDGTTEEFSPQEPEDEETGILCRWRIDTDGEVFTVGLSATPTDADTINDIRTGKSQRFHSNIPPSYAVRPVPQIDRLGGVVMANEDYSSYDDDISMSVVMPRVEFGVVGPTDKAIEVAVKIAESLH